jgi:flavin reductase (DIM6/NTAB) family NADH-FMN oxidoreductase RutF
MKTVDPANIPVADMHRILLGAVAPRPIAFASTIDKNGIPNLSPFSFFNAFGANPPTLVFSPSRRGRDNTTKHTFDNLKEVPEVVINVVNFDIVQQTSLASTEYPKGVNEFVKSGLTSLPSEKVRPPRVKESPVQFECRVQQIIETGDQGGAGNLVICEIVLVHMDKKVLTENEEIDPTKIDLVGRHGGNYYVRAFGDALFEVEKPLRRMGIGIDQLPPKIKLSPYLTGNDLGQLGNIEKLPNPEEIEQFKAEYFLESTLNQRTDSEERARVVTNVAKNLLEEKKVEEALKVLLGYL